MTDSVLIALIAGAVAGIPATLTAAGGLIVSLKNGRKADQTADKVDDAAVKQEHIRELVNSNLTKVKDDLAEAKQEILSLRALISSLQPKGSV